MPQCCQEKAREEANQLHAETPQNPLRAVMMAIATVVPTAVSALETEVSLNTIRIVF